MGVRVLKGGMLTTVQDLGRTGYQSQGFGVSGVMDVRSFKIANLLLDNPENEAVLEFTLMGPTLEFTSETIIAITGGDFQPQVNGKPIKNYTAVYIHRGDILSFRGARTGSRGYIAFSSYLDIPVVMGSRSTNIKCSIGGYKGRRLMDGDYVGFRIKRRYLPYYLSRTLDLDEFDQDEVTLRVIMGPQDKSFTTAGRKTFLESEYTVTAWDAVWKGLLLPTKRHRILFPMELPLVPFRYQATENRSFCFLTARPPEDMPKLPLSFPWIFQNWFSGKQTTKYGFRQLLWKKPSN